jgi:hypothetical protein
VAEDSGSVQLRSREDVQRLFVGKPTEWAQVLAARAALRVLPLLAPLFEELPPRASINAAECFLALLRGALLPSLVATTPSRAGALRLATSTAAAAAAYAFTYTSEFQSKSASFTASAAATTASAGSVAAYASTAAASAIAASDLTESQIGYDALSYDAAFLTEVGQSAALLVTPLWGAIDPPVTIGFYWSALAAALRQADGASDWNLVWIDWYEAIRDGRAPWGLPREVGEQILVETMLWPQEEWDKGALHINRRIAELIEAAREILAPSEDELPQQERFAHRFNGLASEPIDLARPDDATDRLQDGPDRQEDYTDIRLKTEDLAALGTNRLGHLAAALERLRSLPNAVADTRAQSFWSVANTLRIKLAGHEAAEAHHTSNHARPDYEKDERLLEALVGDGLKDLVQTINAFVLGDPSLMDRDAARPGPQETQIAHREAELIAPVVADVSREPDLATRDASGAVADELVKTATTGASLAERQGAEAGRRSIRNFVAALLRRAYVPIKKAGPGAAAEAAFAWKEMRSGFYKKAGEVTLIGGVAGAAIWLTGQWAVIAEFVAHHAAALSAYAASAFPNNPAVVRIIEAIAKVFGP